MENEMDGFKKGTGCYKCVSCGKMTRETPTNRDAAFNHSCEKCYEEGGWLNSHADGMHEPGDHPDECPDCRAFVEEQKKVVTVPDLIPQKDETHFDCLSRWVKWMDYEESGLLNDLTSFQAILDMFAVIEHYGVDFMSGVVESVGEGEDPRVLIAFLEKHELQTKWEPAWLTATSGPSISN